MKRIFAALPVLSIAFAGLLNSSPADAANLIYSDVEIRGFRGKCLDVRGPSSTNGTPVQLWDCVGVPQQHWDVYDNGEIRSRFNTEKCLDLRGPSNVNGARVQIWDCTDIDNQKWRLTSNKLIRSLWNNKCLDVRGPSSTNGTPIQMWSCLGVSNQKFYTNAVPSRYDCDAFVRNDSRTRSRNFSIPRTPRRGVVVIETFIPQAWVNGPPWNIQGKGDNRTHQPAFDPARTRLFTKLDFNTGKGCVVSNWSEVRSKACSWTSAQPYCTYRTFDATAIESGMGSGDSWIIHHGFKSFTYRYHMENTIGGSEFPTCAIDHQFNIDPDGEVDMWGDGFPSVGVYRYANNSRDKLPTTQFIQTANALDDLCALE